MKFSELLEIENINEQKAFILGMIYAWPIFSENEDKVLAYSSYRIDNSPRMNKKLEYNQKFYIEKHNDKLKKFLGELYEVSKNSDIKKNEIKFDKKIGSGVSVVFENDINKKSVYGVIEKWLIDTDEKFKKYFLSGFMDSRGSLDFTGNYYSIDIARGEFPELVKRKLNRLNDILGMIYNFNSRILQKKSSKKNDQFRINLEYFAGHYGFFRPHIIEYYEKEKKVKLFTSDKNLFKDKNFIKKKLLVNTKNFELNDFAISLKGLTKDEKIKKVQEYKMEKFDFDTEEEILYSSYNTKEKAKNNANYICEFNHKHNTFTSKSTKEKYVEAHHLIPFSKRKKFEVNIDIEENLIALCPNCHRLIHLAEDEERISLLNNLFSFRKEKLENQMIEISIEQLYKMYNVECKETLNKHKCD